MWRLLFLAAGFTLLVWLAVDLGLERILEMLGRVGWQALTIAAVYFAYQAMRAAALVASVTGPGRLTWRGALAIRLSGEAVQFLTFTGPFLAEPAKALLLRKHGLTAGQGFSATLAEYLINSFVGAVFAIVALVWLLGRNPEPAALRVAIVIALIVLSTFLITAGIAIART